MKGILCACLLISLQSITAAEAYEADIHFSTTYVLARAAGWPQPDALTIASANQGVDENQDTVAALEAETGPSSSAAGYVTSSFHQAEKNLRFHCFSRTPTAAGRISADVFQVMSGHFAAVADRVDGPRRATRRLIALGAALHCQQDAYAHVEFGGTCGSYPGSCFGHTYQTFLDQVAFSLLKKHYFDPDHPAVSGRWLPRTLQGTARELTARRPTSSARAIPVPALARLAAALRRSGLELPDDVRRECNRYIAGKWLFEFLDSAGSTRGGSDMRDKLAPQVARNCMNPSLAGATVVRIPEPRFPRMNADASPALVRADGSYQVIREGSLVASWPGARAPVSAGRSANYRAREFKVQLSHWRQLVTLPLVEQVAHLSVDGSHQPR